MREFNMNLFVVSLYFIVVSLFGASMQATDIRIPPTIVQGPKLHQIYRSDADVDMTCVATSSLRVEYSWIRNGALLNMNSQNIQPARDGTGSFTISPAVSTDAGFYQCYASNQYGTAVSNTSHLQRAILDKEGGHADIRVLTADEGQPFHIPVNLPKCFPSPSFSWEIGKVVDDQPRVLSTSNRVQIRENGELHFAYVQLDDATPDDLVYKCTVNNPYMDVKQGSSYTKVTVRPRKSEQFRPTKAFVSSTPTVAVVGRNVTLRCFFYGNPAPTIQFTRRDRSLPLNRITISKQDTELLIRDVQPEDEGDYVCRASNIVDSAEEIIQIDVQAAPVFRRWADRPHDVNVTNGDTVVFMCNAEAEPAANILWMKNGKPLDDKNLPAKFELSDNKRKLTISDVCKDCEDGSSDLQVIQCNASNVHGYAFSDGYVNVLLRTKIDEKPQSVHLEYDQTSATFRCSATSDDSTPVKIDWYYRDNDGYETVVRNVTDRIAILNDGQVLTLSVPENTTGAWAKLRGMYRCRASNGYSTDGVLASLKVDDPPTTVTEVIPPPVEQLAEAGIGDLWWIFVLIAIILLIIILLICCCICLQRRKGDTYKVDEKERKNGNDPEKEIADSGFHDYRRPDSEPLKGSRASLVSSSKLSEDDDASSLNEYGDIDAGKFTEDGSFIGDYGTEQRTRTRGRANDSVA
jgi:hypothetical protein